ncbi:hypothetical protein CLUG_02137 [Clavispora lusitaniae ATCC 42720]|uniref:Uncharacterized protein n=1 Tax=Clavispora lusitaniae (strain ATCC 42720) TaxID=306902 RepID=C4Y1Q5_CLAL4|nr:uncharacterized protein CLUG_02137 [Clavispora lusitaniae ATCC 42720]EEQ38012.1 hypothetical protein CLUG_02137 [Clavispora lusitaniae ATCC 42720]
MRGWRLPPVSRARRSSVHAPLGPSASRRRAQTPLARVGPDIPAAHGGRVSCFCLEPDAPVHQQRAPPPRSGRQQRRVSPSVASFLLCARVSRRGGRRRGPLERAGMKKQRDGLTLDKSVIRSFSYGHKIGHSVMVIRLVIGLVIQDWSFS